MRPRLKVKKRVFSISQDGKTINKIDKLADRTDLGLDRSKIIGDIVEKNLGDYGEAMDFIHETREECKRNHIGFCDVCARQEYLETGKINAEKHSNIELINIAKVVETNQNSNNYGKHIKSQYHFKCKNGHKIGYNIDVFDYNPFKGKNAPKMKLTKADLE